VSKEASNTGGLPQGGVTAVGGVEAEGSSRDCRGMVDAEELPLVELEASPVEGTAGDRETRRL
jgi:hypothetical protein